MAMASSAMGGDVLRVAKTVHHVNALMLRGLSQAGVGALTQHFFGQWIDRDDAPSLCLHVLRDTVAVAMRLGRQAHHGNGAAVGEAEVRRVLFGAHEAGHLSVQSWRGAAQGSAASA